MTICVVCSVLGRDFPLLGRDSVPWVLCFPCSGFATQPCLTHKRGNTSATWWFQFKAPRIREMFISKITSCLFGPFAPPGRGKRAGSPEGVSPSGRQSLNLPKCCQKGVALLKLCQKGQSLPKLCQKGQTFVKRAGERGRKVTLRVRLNAHKPLHWRINNWNRVYIE